MVGSLNGHHGPNAIKPAMADSSTETGHAATRILNMAGIIVLVAILTALSAMSDFVQVKFAPLYRYSAINSFPLKVGDMCINLYYKNRNHLLLYESYLNLNSANFLCNSNGLFLYVT